MKKILLLSCNTGEGHNSAAKAIAAEAVAEGLETEIADPLAFQSKRMKSAASSIYNGIIKSKPKLFGAIYKAGSLYSSTGLRSPVYFANSIYTGNLSGYLAENGFDCVVCTHLFGMEAMTALYNKGIPAIPSYGILTDYTCIPFFQETRLTGYFIPHEDLRAEMTEKGIPSEKIHATGIPIHPKFSVSVSKQEARKILGIPEQDKVCLIMTGGVGCETMLSLCDAFAMRQSEGISVYVLVGRNEDLRGKIETKYPSSMRIRAIPFTDRVSLYMNASDVMISKSGGLSSTEAAAAGIPLVHLMTIPGCETKNAEFFERHGMSLTAKTAYEAVDRAIFLIKDAGAAETMLQMQKKHCFPDAAKRVLRQIREEASRQA